MQLMEDGADGEEVKREKMEVEQDAEMNNGRGPAAAYGRQQRRLTLAEYEEQFETRYALEIQTFVETIVTLDKLVEKNPLIEDFIL